jgi:hypothetical protein
MSEKKIEFNVFEVPVVVRAKLRKMIKEGKITEQEAIEIYRRWRAKVKALEL